MEEKIIGTLEAKGYWPNQLFKIMLIDSGTGSYTVRLIKNGEVDATTDVVMSNLNEACQYYAYLISSIRFANN